MFTKLFEIRIVANNFCDLPNSLLIRRSLTLSPCSISLRSDGVSEKKAISEADTNPEQNKRKHTNTKLSKTPPEGGVN